MKFDNLSETIQLRLSFDFISNRPHIGTPVQLGFAEAPFGRKRAEMRKAAALPSNGYKLLLLAAQLAPRAVVQQSFYGVPLRASIQYVPVVNRVIFPSCLRPTHPLNTSSSHGTLKISQLQLNYRTLRAVRVIYLAELIREKAGMIKLVMYHAKQSVTSTCSPRQ